MRKRFHRIESGKKLAGVCLGLAEYFDIDVTLVRVLFVVLILLTGGATAVAYLILWLVAPVAAAPGQEAEPPPPGAPSR